MARKINPHTHTDWRRWYASYEWRRRARRQMANEPLCAMCLAEGRVVPAEVADHVERVDGDYTRFRLGKLQSLCKAHHERSKDHVERHGFRPDIGPDGWPLDPAHPTNIRVRG